MHMPPPVHGAAMMGQYIHDSQLINNEFDCNYINLSASKEIDEIGKIKIQKLYFLFSNTIKIIRTVKKYKPQLCYITPSTWDWGFYRDWILIKILKILKCNIVVHFHNKGNSDFKSKWYNRILYKDFFKNIRCIFIAQNLADEFKEYLSPKNIFICPNGIPITLPIPINREKIHDPFTFIFLSNMIESKGVIVLLKSCQLLKQQGYKFKCNFIGRWSDVTEKDFAQYLDKFDLKDCVKAFGSKYGKEKEKFFIEADALVFPTYYEGETFGLVLLEGMEFSLPCISTYEGSIPLIIQNHETGLLVSSQDVEDLALKMEWLINHPEAGLKMGQKGRQRFLEKYTLSVFEHQMLNILNSCINNE